MASRYQELYRVSPNLYLEGSPVLIQAGVLQKDNQLDEVLVQLKILNISAMNIIACKVSVDSYETNGTKLEGIEDFSYLDFKAKYNDNFGSKNPIYLPNKNTRRFNPYVTEIVFDDGSIWSSNKSDWTSIDNTTLINQINDSDLIQQIKLEIGHDADFVPMLQKNVFQCVCGAMSVSDDGICYKCKRNIEELIHKYDLETFGKNKEARLQKEREAKEEAERKAALLAEEERIREEKIRREAKIKADAKNKKIKKIILSISIPSSIIIFITSIIIINWDTISNNYLYSKAQRLVKTQSFDEALVIYSQIDGFKDSAEQINYTKYQMADYYCNEENYKKAMDLFDELRGYNDSNIRYDNCIIEFEYKKAVDMNKNEQAFEALLKIKNSQTRFDIESNILRTCNVGDEIAFGDYHGNNIWIVVDKKDGKVLLLSKNVLIPIRYNEKNDNVTWNSCTLREWLNSSYIQETYSAKERNCIIENNGENKMVDLSDKVFILSESEVKYYFPNKNEIFNENVSWWLRNNNEEKYGGDSNTFYVKKDTIGKSSKVDIDGIYVRPAIWVDLNKLNSLED